MFQNLTPLLPQINITVLGVNDNAPKFHQRRYLAPILPSYQLGQVVANVSAYDPDLVIDDTNPPLTFSFSQPTDLLTMDPKTGSIRLNRDASQMSQREIEFSVSVSDSKFTSHAVLILRFPNPALSAAASSNQVRFLHANASNQLHVAHRSLRSGEVIGGVSAMLLEPLRVPEAESSEAPAALAFKSRQVRKMQLLYEQDESLHDTRFQVDPATGLIKILDPSDFLNEVSVEERMGKFL